jgi:hypothetical protein
VTLRVIILALAASGFTAMASVAQRRAAAPAPGEFSFNLHLVGFLLRRPVWFLGILCMILGFVFQVAALRVGSLSVVQPVIATELVIVFGVIALQSPSRPLARLDLGRRHGCRVGCVPGAGSASWWTGRSVHVSVGSVRVDHFRPGWNLGRPGYLPRRQGHRSGTGRKAALLGIAAAVGFGFVAAVVKELSTHLSQGSTAVFLN